MVKVPVRLSQPVLLLLAVTIRVIPFEPLVLFRLNQVQSAGLVIAQPVFELRVRVLKLPPKHNISSDEAVTFRIGSSKACVTVIVVEILVFSLAESVSVAVRFEYATFFVFAVMVRVAFPVPVVLLRFSQAGAPVIVQSALDVMFSVALLFAAAAS